MASAPQQLAGEGTSQLGFILHPLPLLNMNIGILFGTRTERDVAVENAFEIEFDGEKIDQTFLRKRIDLYKTTFPSQDAIGWYHIRPDCETLHPDEKSLALHEQMQFQDDLDLSLMLTFNPLATANTTQLPLKAFELVFRDKETEFAEIPIRVETGDAERIGVDDIVKGAQSTSGQHLDSHLQTENNAIFMFYARLKVVRDYISAVRAGEVEPNYPVLRQINAFMSRLSQAQDENLQKLLDQQELNVLSTGLMAAVTKGTQVGVDVQTKRNVNIYADKESKSSSGISGVSHHAEIIPDTSFAMNMRQHHGFRGH